MSRVEASLEEILSPQRQRKRVYSLQKRLRCDMIGDNPIYQLFVSGSSTGCDKHFFCMICHRDVSMESRGSLEFGRNFFGKRHWQLDVTYRVQNGLWGYFWRSSQQRLSLCAACIASAPNFYWKATTSTCLTCSIDWLDVWSIVGLSQTWNASQPLRSSVHSLWTFEVVMLLVIWLLKIFLISSLIC